MIIKRIKTDHQIQACFEVAKQLRPHLIEADFVDRVRHQEKTGFRAAAVFDANRVCAFAGYRVFDCLSRGRVLYVDDLVTHLALRSQGVGRRLFAWLIMEARREKCDYLDLDSGVQRFAAHRFIFDRVWISPAITSPWK